MKTVSWFVIRKCDGLKIGYFSSYEAAKNYFNAFKEENTKLEISEIRR